MSIETPQPRSFDSIVRGRYADRDQLRNTRPTATRGRHARGRTHRVALGWSWAVQHTLNATAALGFMLSTMLGRS